MILKNENTSFIILKTKIHSIYKNKKVKISIF